MSNRDLYKDEFGVYREVDEETEETIDGMEDDEQDHYEDDEDEYLDSDDEYQEEDSDDEDAAYLKERRSDYDVDED